MCQYSKLKIIHKFFILHGQFGQHNCFCVPTCGRRKSKLTKRKDEIAYFLPDIDRNKQHPNKKKQQSPEVSPHFDFTAGPTKERIIISIASENQPSPAYERAQQLCSSPNLRAESAPSNVYTRLEETCFYFLNKTLYTESYL